jgi:phosphoglycolate phosphatase-like HAD superfamily hydrolase
MSAPAQQAEVLAALAQVGVVARPAADGSLRMTGPRADWLAVALPALGVEVARAAAEYALAAGEPRTRLLAALAVAVRPAAVLLDLDGVLADIARRTALADPDQVAALAALAPLAVVTTCPRRLAESVLTRHGYARHIGAIVGVEDAAPKPDPAPVRLAMRRLGAGTAWMVGDNPSDVFAARGAGALPLAIAPRGVGAETHAEALRDAGAVRLLANLGELVGLLKDLRST